MSNFEQLQQMGFNPEIVTYDMDRYIHATDPQTKSTIMFRTYWSMYHIAEKIEESRAQFRGEWKE